MCDKCMHVNALSKLSSLKFIQDSDTVLTEVKIICYDRSGVACRYKLGLYPAVSETYAAALYTSTVHRKLARAIYMYGRVL